MAGETTTDLVTTATPLYVSKSVGQVVAQPHTVEVRTTDLATNDITGICKVPKGATVIGFILQTDDLDTDGSVALVWSILIGTTVFVAGIANDTAKAGTFAVGSSGHVTVTADTVVSLKATTAAATAAAGTVNLTPLYITSE